MRRPIVTALSIRAMFSTFLLGVVMLTPIAAQAQTPSPPAPSATIEADRFTLQLTTVRRGYDGKTCWVHPRAGIVPGSGGNPEVVLTMQKLLLTGSDVFYALNETRSSDGGSTWSAPLEHADDLGRRPESSDVIVNTCDFTPKWHAASGKLLGIGQTVRYRDNQVIHNAPRQTTYAVYDPHRRRWTPWRTLALPDRPEFHIGGAGSVQRVDLPNGEILLPIYFRGKEEPHYRVAVFRCRFDGQELKYVEHGADHTVAVGRGLFEPSLVKFQDHYYLTLRNDRAGYVTRSRDGLNFEPPRRWNWDDGSELGNYNTQQHWVAHSDALYLVYTRRGANNDHVFRHRAPLFIAEVDVETLQVKRATERVLVPERGARLGNFGVVAVSEQETWVTVAEWMQTWGPNHVIPPDNKYGADNSVYAARILWKTPNSSWQNP